MKADLIDWLAHTGSWAWHAAAALLVFINAGAGLAVLATRSLSLVDRWTPRWLAANVAVLGFGLGTPLLTWALRLGLAALPTFGTTLTVPK
ncbi:MAG: hypothetical protein IPI92_00785 [Gemmatimonadetes bacterium]|nr:hypothetical protein [Gemmatimonadota bacterium]MBK7783015.1 hypothetical protein [Gemmatimonadota bacterium]